MQICKQNRMTSLARRLLGYLRTLEEPDHIDFVEREKCANGQEEGVVGNRPDNRRIEVAGLFGDLIG